MTQPQILFFIYLFIFFVGNACRNVDSLDSGTDKPVCITNDTSGSVIFKTCDIPRCEKTHFPGKSNF